MLKYIATAGAALIFLGVLAAGFFGLRGMCSSDGQAPKFETPLKPDGGKENPEHSGAGQQTPAPEWEQTKPSATFDLRVAENNKIEGRYYSEKAEKEDWGHKFFCDIKIGEVLLAIFTLFLVFYTARLYWATNKLADADRPHMYVSEMGVKGINDPPDADGFVTLLLDYKFTNYGRSPAFLRNFELLCESQKLASRPTYQSPAAIKFIIAVNSWYGSLQSHNLRVDGADIREILMGNAKLYLFGRIEYGGIGGAIHVHRFAYSLVFGAGGASERFYPDGPDAYWENT